MRKAFLALMSTLALCACGHSVSGDPTLDITDAERDARIALDFSRDSAWIVNYLQPYYPELTEAQVSAWEASKALEGRVIDGQKRYFRNAGRNLFRIDPEARKVFEAVNGVTRDVEDVYLDDYNSTASPATWKTSISTTTTARSSPRSARRARTW